jgi:hypothetical protein
MATGITLGLFSVVIFVEATENSAAAEITPGLRAAKNYCCSGVLHIPISILHQF